MSDSWNAETTKALLLYVAEQLIAHKALLTEVDNKIGDGDHGIGMSKGMQAAKDKLNALPPTDDVIELFEVMGKAMMMSMGGASGVLFGSMFRAGTSGKAPQSTLNPQDLATLIGEGLSEIKKRGKAHVGDKTMVDALEPAVEVLQQNSEEGFYKMLLAAEQAAQHGVESTKSMVAQTGRARYLGERSIGFQDAGATSVWLIIKAMREFAEVKL